MRNIQIANQNGLVNNDHLIYPLPTIPDPIPSPDYVHVSIPCVLVPTLVGSLANLLDPRRWDHGASRDSVEHSIGVVLDLLDAMGVDCGESSAMLDYIKDLYQNGCELIAVNPDDTERIVWSAHYCMHGGIGTPPPGWEPPAPDGPGTTGWDDPDELIPDGDITDAEWCGVAGKAVEYMVAETDSLMFAIDAATDMIEAVVGFFGPGVPMPAWALAVAADTFQNAVDAGTAYIQGLLASPDFQEAAQCAFFCALKRHKKVNADVIQEALYDIVSANGVYATIVAFWEPIFNFSSVTGSAQYWGSILSRSALAARMWLGLDEPDDDCATLCTNCSPVGWKATLDLRRGDVQSLVTLLQPGGSIVDMYMDTTGLHSGYYKDGPNYFPQLKFRLSWLTDALLQRMVLTSEVVTSHAVTDPASDYIYIVPEGGGAKYSSPVPRGPYQHVVEWAPVISPERADITYVLSKRATDENLVGNMIRVTKIEMWGSGSPPAALIPYSETYT